MAGARGRRVPKESQRKTRRKAEFHKLLSIQAPTRKLTDKLCVHACLRFVGSPVVGANLSVCGYHSPSVVRLASHLARPAVYRSASLSLAACMCGYVNDAYPYAECILAYTSIFDAFTRQRGPYSTELANGMVALRPTYTCSNRNMRRFPIICTPSIDFVFGSFKSFRVHLFFRLERFRAENTRLSRAFF